MGSLEKHKTLLRVCLGGKWAGEKGQWGEEKQRDCRVVPNKYPCVRGMNSEAVGSQRPLDRDAACHWTSYCRSEALLEKKNLQRV